MKYLDILWEEFLFVGVIGDASVVARPLARKRGYLSKWSKPSDAFLFIGVIKDGSSIRRVVLVGISTGVVDFLTVFSTEGDIRETSAFPSEVFSVGALDSMHTGRRFIHLPLGVLSSSNAATGVFGIAAPSG